MSMAKRWDSAWEGSVVALARSPFGGLEGRAQGDRDMVRRATMKGRIRSERDYNELCRILGDWGYAVETPADFAFAESIERKC
jgi:hypothetical protein